MTGQETLKVLLETHFPDSKEFNNRQGDWGQSNVEPYWVNRENFDMLQRTVNRAKLRGPSILLTLTNRMGLIYQHICNKELMLFHHFFVAFLEPV